jgi:hypothetical protein
MEGVGDIVLYVCTFSYRLCWCSKCWCSKGSSAWWGEVSAGEQDVGGADDSRGTVPVLAAFTGLTAPGGGSGSRSPPFYNR